MYCQRLLFCITKLNLLCIIYILYSYEKHYDATIIIILADENKRARKLRNHAEEEHKREREREKGKRKRKWR